MPSLRSLFSDSLLADAWNADAAMQGDLAGNGFDANIGFGFKGSAQAVGYIEVRSGRAVRAAAYRDQALEWDLRASADDWKLWLTEGFGLKRLGFTTATGRLRFERGNYRQMVRNPSLARPFLRVFELMQGLETDW